MEKGKKITLELEAADILKFAIKRQVTDLFKDFLFILKSNKDKHGEALDKLYSSLPEEYKKYVDLADYYTDGESDRLRSQVLQKGNDSIRNLNQQIDELFVDFK